MNKKIISVIALLMALLMLASCNNELVPPESTPEETPEETPVINDGSDVSEEVPPPDYDFMGNDLTQFVTVGQYKGYELEVPPLYYMTDEEWREELDRSIILYGCHEKITDRAVLESDIVKLSYEGWLGDEKFEGGTGSSEYFTVYNGGGFIEGFAEGVVGAIPGEQFDLNVTFPEDYHAEDLAGKAVVFKVTVECIYKAEVLTDEKVVELSNGAIKTVAEFEQQTKDLMIEDAEQTYENNKLDAVWEKIFDASVIIELPEDLVQDYYEYNLSAYQYYATQNWMTLDAFLEYIGVTKDQIMEESRNSVFTDMVVYSIAKAENISISEEEYKEMLTQLAEAYGCTEDEIFSYYKLTEDDVNDMFLFTKAYESVLEWNTFIDKEPSEDAE